MSRRRTKKTRFITGFTIIMISLSIGFAIPSIIEGINVGRNWQCYSQIDQTITTESYTVIRFDLETNNRISAEIRAYDAIFIHDDPVPVIFAILSEGEFSIWYDAGENAPNILNSTHFYENSHITLENLGVEYDSEYYFIFYNTNAFTIRVDLTLSIIPWGHIIATSIVGFGFSICFLGLLTKIGLTGYFVLSRDEKPKVLTVQSQDKTEAVLQPEKDESFCVSCGAPTTKKNGRYCPNCGSST